MRYIKIVFLCDPIVEGFMEVDEATGVCNRLTAVDGVTIPENAMPSKQYSVINDNPAFPAWGLVAPPPVAPPP